MEKATRWLAERWLERDQARAVNGGYDINLLIDGYLPAARDAVALILSAIRDPDDAVKRAMFDDGRIALNAWRNTVDAILAQKKD